MIFAPRQNRTMLAAAIAQLQLIYHQTVFNLRNEHRNALTGLILSVMQSLTMIVAFFLLFWVMGTRTSPVRGDYLIYIMTGIFMFRTHIKAVQAVATSGRGANALTLHQPMTTAVGITASALAELYRQTLASAVILGGYYIFNPFTLQDPVGLAGMFLLAWASGGAIGLVLLALRPWAPDLSTILMRLVMRANMVFSGKMFLANLMPSFLLPMFTWNPLFHIVDQSRGFAFINYAPQKTSLTYPIFAAIAIMMLGLIGEHVTRKHESVSWSAGR